LAGRDPHAPWGGCSTRCKFQQDLFHILHKSGNSPQTGQIFHSQCERIMIAELVRDHLCFGDYALHHRDSHFLGIHRAIAHMHVEQSFSHRDNKLVCHPIRKEGIPDQAPVSANRVEIEMVISDLPGGNISPTVLWHQRSSSSHSWGRRGTFWG